MNDFLMWMGGIIISGIFGLIGWVFKMVFGAIKTVEDDHKELAQMLSDHKIHAAETFATRQEVNEGFDRVLTKLDAIDNKLDKKADK